MGMSLNQAQALASIIKREAPGAATTIQTDEPRGNIYHVEVHKPDVIRFVVKSIGQWNERKHLLQKYDRGGLRAMFITRKEYSPNAIGYVVVDDYGHEAQLTPMEAQELHQWLHDHAAQIHNDVNGIATTSDEGK